MKIINIKTEATCGLDRCPIHKASHSIYIFEINTQEVFNRTCNRSLIFARRQQVSDPNLVFGKDSLDIFNDLFDVAMTDLLLAFARWQRREDILSRDGKIYDIDGNEIEYNEWLQDPTTGDYQLSIITTNVNDETVLSGLSVTSIDYLIKRILEQFYGVDFGSKSAMQRIVDILNYQQKKIKIKTSLF